MNNLKMELIFIFIGVNFYLYQENIGMRCLNDGIEYYAEVHTSFYNSLIHTIFMPITMLGMYLWIPAIFNLNIYMAYKLKKYITLFYLGLYLRISTNITILIVIWYSFSYILSSYLYKYFYVQKMDSSACLFYGLVIAISALLFQEIFGHYIGGDDVSRLEAIPNAILYAPYYSVSHLFK